MRVIAALLSGLLLLLAPAALAQQTRELEALEGERLEEFLRLRVAALEARVAHLTAVSQAQEKIRAADAAARTAQDAERALGAWTLEASGGRAECLPDVKGEWSCGEGRRAEGEN